jgi:hypothetical protein
MRPTIRAALAALGLLASAAVAFAACSHDADQCANSNSCPPTYGTTGSTTGTGDAGAMGGGGSAASGGGGHGGHGGGSTAGAGGAAGAGQGGG